MYIKDTWIKFGEHNYMNLYDFIKDKSHGVYVEYEEPVVKEVHSDNILDMEHNAGIVLKFKDGSCKTLVELSRGDLKDCIQLVRGSLKYNGDVEIETNLDSQIEKLNKRRSLLGISDRYTTDGVSIIDTVTEARIKETVKNAQYVGFKLVKGKIDQYIDDYDFLDLVNLRFAEMQFRAHKPTKLRYIATSFKHATVKLDSNITIGEAVYLNVTPDMAPRIDRMTEVYLFSKGVYDLSKVSFIGQINIENDDIILDFGDNFVNIDEKSINSGVHRVTIKYKNDKYDDLFGKMDFHTIIKES